MTFPVTWSPNPTKRTNSTNPKPFTQIGGWRNQIKTSLDVSSRRTANVPPDFAREMGCSSTIKTLSAWCLHDVTARYFAIPSTTLTSTHDCAYLHFLAKSFSILFVRYPYGFVGSRHYDQQSHKSNMAAQGERRYYEEESFYCNTIEDRVLSHYRRQWKLALICNYWLPKYCTTSPNGRQPYAFHL